MNKRYQFHNNTYVAMGLFNRKENEREKQKNRTFKCKRCDMIFNDKERLKRHDRKAHFGKKGKRKREI